MFTFLIEATGAVALYVLWGPRLGWSQAWWPAIFHSISGFCNAGFSTNSDSLMSWQDSSMTLMVIAGLIVAGGLGFLTMLLMAVGGAPGSTAGGMKVTTFALIVLLAWSRLRGFETTVFANRSIPQDTIQRAIGLVVLSSVVMALGGFALMVTEPSTVGESTFLNRTFEVVSAFNTVGLSLNETPTLTLAGRWVVIGLMFLGRVGPMTLTAALVIESSRRGHFRYAYEDVAVG